MRWLIAEVGQRRQCAGAAHVCRAIIDDSRGQSTTAIKPAVGGITAAQPTPHSRSTSLDTLSYTACCRSGRGYCDSFRRAQQTSDCTRCARRSTDVVDSISNSINELSSTPSFHLLPVHGRRTIALRNGTCRRCQAASSSRWRATRLQQICAASAAPHCHSMPGSTAASRGVYLHQQDL